jgi:hypothetical protein
MTVIISPLGILEEEKSAGESKKNENNKENLEVTLFTKPGVIQGAEALAAM